MESVMEELFTGLGLFYWLYTMGMSLFGIAAYVLSALGIYSIAKRRGINHPWMSWVPVLNLWVVGCISDQYQYVVKGKNKNKRKWLLGLNIALAVVYIVFFVIFGVMAFNVVASAAGDISEAAILESMVGPAVAMLICVLPLMGLAIAVIVIRYIAMYDLYTSCNPQNNVLFLVLSIFFSVTEPFFVFFNRKKDDGMPPRRQQPQYIPPQPAYEPPREPWENPEDQ